MIKASLVISSYNCNRELPNTFYAISRQKTNFEFEVCYIDDCSYEDPKFIYDYFLRVKHKKGMRLKQHIGSLGNSGSFLPNKFKNSFAMLLDMVSPESEIIILNHGDVIMPYDNMIQKFVDEVEEGVIKVPEIHTISIPQDLYINFEEGIEKAFKSEEEKPLYQGVNRNSLALTLMCLYKKDLEKLEFQSDSHEVSLKIKMKKLGYKIINYEGMVGIHQSHGSRPNVHLLDSHQVLYWDYSKDPEKEYYA